MRKEQETIEINKLYEKFKNAKTDREKMEILAALFCFENRINHVISKNNSSLVEKMEVEYFFPVDENGNLDKKKQSERFTAFNEWHQEKLIIFGQRIDDYKKKFDVQYGPSTDEKGRDNNMELAKKYGEISAEGQIIADGGEFIHALFAVNGEKIEKAFGKLGKEFILAVHDNYNSALEKLPADKQRLCKLAKEHVHNTPFVMEHYDKSSEASEDANYFKSLISNPVLKDLVGDRKFDTTNMAQITSWHSVRNNEKMEKIMEAIKANTRESHKNSALYQNIIDRYDRACDAPTASKFAHEMKQLGIACKDYIAHRNPFFDDGKARLDLVKSLDEHIDKVLMPTINKKVDTFELVDAKTLLKEMEEEELKDTGKKKNHATTKMVKPKEKNLNEEAIM